MDSTKVIIKNNYGSYLVAIEKVDLTLEELLSEAIIPALLAAGYRPSTIQEYINVD